MQTIISRFLVGSLFARHIVTGPNLAQLTRGRPTRRLWFIIVHWI